MKVVVIGLGTFGIAVCKHLYRNGVEVLAMDLDMDEVNNATEYSTNAVKLDATSINALRKFKVFNYDVAVVAIGERFEDNVLVVSELKELGVPRVITKTTSKRMRQILYKIGADEVYIPEKEFGITLAKKIMQKNALELIPITDEYAILEIKVPPKFVGVTLKDLGLRKKYGINILVIRKQSDTNTEELPDNDQQNKQEIDEIRARYTEMTMPTADTVLEGHEILLVLGKNPDLEKLAAEISAENDE